MKENTKFITEEKQFYEVMKKMDIPTESVSEAITYLTGFMNENQLTDDNRSIYMVMMAVCAYHAGKSKVE